jgi:hypothetical protein
MAITAITRDFNNEPNIVRIVSSDNLAAVAAANYILNQAANITALNSGTWTWLVGDVVLVQASDGDQFFHFSGSDFTSLVQLPGGNGSVTLPVVDHNFVNFDGTLGALEDLGFSASDATKTKVVMAGSAVQVGYIPHFVDTAGTIDDTAGTIQNDGSIQAGKSGVAGTLISFPGTAANGSLILAGVNAGANFNTTISNGTMGQSTVYTMGDIGAATGGLVVATAAIRMKSVAGAAAAGGAAAQSFTDAFCTTGSNVIGNWNTQANAASVLKIVPGNGSFVVTSSADAGVGTFNYIIIK